MKTRNILITIGILLILFNVLSYAGERSDMPENVDEVAYQIGRNIFFIAGVILLLMAYKKHRKMVAKKEKDMIDNFLN